MKIIDDLNKKIFPSKDYIVDKKVIDNIDVFFIYNEVLCDAIDISENVLKRFTLFKRNNIKNIKNSLPDINIIDINEDEIFKYINNGYVVIICKYFTIAIEFRKNLNRSISEATSELSLNGSKDAFTENFNTNLGLIRKRLKTTDLKVIDMIIGRSSNTKVGILYMDNIVNMKTVDKIKKSLDKIDIDGIIDSSYLKNNLEKNKSYFPTIMLTERPDKTSMNLLEGKVVILVDMSPYALILPCFLIDFFHTTDDYYQKDINTSFIRLIRIFAFFVALYLPGLYLSITLFNQDLIPLNLLLNLKAARTGVPFPIIIESLFMLISFEVLKESDIRMSATSGSAISILGGLILGDAAVSAGILSPITIIVIAISSIAGLVFTEIELVNAIRSYRLFFLICASLSGALGLIIGTVYLLYSLIKLKPFGIDYLYPFIPFSKTNLDDSVIRNEKNVKKRNSILTRNIVRGKYK